MGTFPRTGGNRIKGARWRSESHHHPDPFKVVESVLHLDGSRVRLKNCDGATPRP